MKTVLSGFRLLPLLLASACTWATWGQWDAQNDVPDADGDGHAALDRGGDDCDDEDASVYPGAAETAGDGVDQDCDAVDHCFGDEDLDGFGFGEPRPGASLACDTPGDSPLATDCDDADADVNPEAIEVCNGRDDDCDALVDQADDSLGERTWFQDGDGDGHAAPGAFSIQVAGCAPVPGYATIDDDCDDADAGVNPAAPEICNGRDDDCDALVDDDDTLTEGPAWYTDADGDGFGDPATERLACERPEGHLANGEDCDDTNPEANPQATERCNGFDDDCNGLADDDDEAPQGTTSWYVDADGDGFGLRDAQVARCEGGAGYAPDPGDCDDAAASINPGAEERCNGVDDDCEGTADGPDATDAGAWYVDADGDGQGESGTPPEPSCAPIPGYADNADDCDDNEAETLVGGTEVCDERDNDCDGDVDEDAIAVLWYRDQDGDGSGVNSNTLLQCERPPGYVLRSGDCLDSRADVFPGAVERCNGFDDDCDSLTDDADPKLVAQSWYRDADADAYGDRSLSQIACAAPAGFVADNTDCDDSKAAVKPGASETCNSIDDDCDALVDDDDPSVTGRPAWYRDADADTWGPVASRTLRCVQPPGFVSRDGDCDDARAEVNPGAQERCATPYDDNCDGAANEATAVDASTWYRDADSDGYGTAANTSKACSRPTGWVSNPNDCADGDPNTWPGAPEICDFVDNDCDGQVDEGATPASWYPDVDGDGFGAFGAAAELSCSRPGTKVQSSTDCNDNNAQVNPSAPERCATSGVDDNCNGVADENTAVDVATWYADADGDTFGNASSSRRQCTAPAGHVANNTDCDDTKAAVKPGAPEICNTLDDDCDTKADDADNDVVGAPSWYRDADGDTFGTPSNTLTRCLMPSGYVSANTDCDDTKAAVKPGATEVCNGYDDDCDGLVDDADPGITGRTTFYRDLDGDGHGRSQSGTTQACAAPSGYAASNDDCNDTNDDHHPGAPEVCDGADSDCNGQLDDDCVVPCPGGETWVGSCNDLQNMQNARTANYCLVRNIDCSATATWNSGAGFAPVGTTASAPFSGKLDGRGFTISGLRINRPSTSYVGVFGHTSGATLTDIKLTGAVVTGQSYIGALVGQSANSTLSNLELAGTLTGTSYAGQIAGRINGGTVNGATVSGQVTCTQDYCAMGAGYVAPATLTGVRASGQVSGRSSVAGVVGYMAASSAVRDSKSTATVTGTSSAVGGIAGQAVSAALERVSNAGSVSSGTSGSQVGGLVGYLDTGSTLDDGWSNSLVRGSSYVGGAVGRARGTGGRVRRVWASGWVWPHSTSNIGGAIGGKTTETTVADVWWDSDLAGVPTSDGGTAAPTADLVQWTTYANYDFANVWRTETDAYPCLRWDSAACPKPPVDLDGDGVPAGRDCDDARDSTFPLALELCNSRDDDCDGTTDESCVDACPSSGAPPPGCAKACAAGVIGVGTCDDLQAINLDGRLDYCLVRDIDCAASASWNTNTGFMPIGNTRPFAGTLDGQGFAIDGLTINRSGSTQALFATTQGATISGLRLTDASVTATSSTVGLLVANAQGTTLDDVLVDGEVRGTSNVGGLVGSGSGLTVVESRALGEVTATSSGAGGLVGYLSGTGNAFTDSYAFVAVTGTTQVGGLAGYAQNLGLTRVWAGDWVLATTTTGTSGGLVGQASGGAPTNAFWDQRSTGQYGVGLGVRKTPAEMVQGTTFTGFDFANVWKQQGGVSYPCLKSESGSCPQPPPDADGDLVPAGVDCDEADPEAFPGAIELCDGVDQDCDGIVSEPCYDKCTGPDTPTACVVACTAGKRPVLGATPSGDCTALQAIGGGGRYCLARDIDCSASATWNGGQGWAPINSFSGELDGQGFAVTGLTINRPGSSSQAMFNTLSGAFVHDLLLYDAEVTGSHRSAVLSSQVNSSTLERVEIQASTIQTSYYSGMMAGELNAATVRECSVEGTANTGYYSGLFAGSVGNNTTFERVSARGTLNAGSNYYLGGLAGSMSGGSIRDAWADVDVIATSHNRGGLVGSVSGVTLERVWSAGAVGSTGSNIGGLVGSASSSPASHAFWDTTNSGRTTSAVGVGLTPTQMGQQSSFTTYDFVNVWHPPAGGRYPCLRWETTPCPVIP